MRGGVEEKVIRTQYADRRAARQEARATYVNSAAARPARTERPTYNAPQGPSNRPQSGAPRADRPAAAQSVRRRTSRPQVRVLPVPAPAPPRPVTARPRPHPPWSAPKTFTTPAKKKGAYEKSYSDSKRTVSKRALVKQQVSVADFDENKSGYRKLRVKKQKQQTVQTIKIDHAVVTSEISR